MKQSSYLKSVDSFKQINKSPLNKSSSKSLWSFGKDSRFKSPIVYCDNIYETSGIKSRKTSFGYGKKHDFTKDLTSSPSSSKYNIKTIFDSNRQTKRGFSIYAGRQKIQDKGHIPLGPLKVPASTRYNNNPNLNKGNSFTMTPKRKNLNKSLSIDSQNNNPGAGTYEDIQTIVGPGKKYLSNHKKTLGRFYNPESPKRFDVPSKNVPGPGAYNEVNTLSNSGKYINSRNTGYGKRYFDKDKRVNDFDKKANKNRNPGPGSYRSPSDFGQYDGDVYNTISFNDQLMSRNNSQKRN